MQHLDIFGGEVSLLYKGQRKHKTWIGGVVSLAVLILLIVRLVTIVDDIKDRASPTVLLQERVFNNSSSTTIQQYSYTITPLTQTFAIGITSDSLVYQVDTRIFTLESFLTVKKKVYNAANKQYVSTTTIIPLTIERCTADHFQIQGVQDYLQNSKYLNHFCLPLKEEIVLEGDPSSDNSSVLSIQIKRCKGTGCLTDDVIDTFFNSNFVELYFSDVYVTPQTKSYPFIHYGKLINCLSSPTLSRSLYINMRNNYVESDFGWVGKDIQSESQPSFYYSEEHISDGTTEDFVNSIVVQFDKKENYYQRSYQKLIALIPEIGSLAFVLTCILTPVCQYYSKIDFDSRIINTTYNFNEVKHKIKTSPQFQQSKLLRDNSLANDKSQQVSHEIAQDKRDSFRIRINSQHLQQYQKKESLFYNGVASKEIKSILKQRDSPNASINSADGDTSNNSSEKNEELKKLMDKMKVYQHNNEVLEKSKLQQNTKSLKEKIVENLKYRQAKEKIKKTLKSISELINSPSEGIKFKVSEYLKSRFCCLFKKQVPDSKIIEKSIEQFYQHIDIHCILNKLMEIEFLKKILLNEDQLILLQFLPKPRLNYSIIENEIIFLDSDANQPINEYQADYDKLIKGINSYKNIIAQEKMQKIDNNLLKQIDHKYLYLFKDQIDKRKPLLLTNTQQQQQQQQLLQPSIFINKLPSLSDRKSSTKKLNSLPHHSPFDSPHYLNVQQQQSIFLQEQQQQNIKQVKENLKQIDSLQNVENLKQINSMQNVENNLKQIDSMQNVENLKQIDSLQNVPIHQQYISQEQELSNEFIFEIDQEQNNSIRNNLEDNVKFHSTHGCILKPIDSNKQDNILLSKW